MSEDMSRNLKVHLEVVMAEAVGSQEDLVRRLGQWLSRSTEAWLAAGLASDVAGIQGREETIPVMQGMVPPPKVWLRGFDFGHPADFSCMWTVRRTR